jgi:hypothetical protein
MKAIAPIFVCCLLLVFGWCLSTPAANVQTLDLTYEIADLSLPITADTQPKDVPAATTVIDAQADQLAFLSGPCRNGSCGRGEVAPAVTRSVEKKVTRETTVSSTEKAPRVTPARNVLRRLASAERPRILRRLLYRR